MNVIRATLPSGQKFSLDLNLNHPTLLPGVQVVTEETLYRGGKLFRPRLCFMMAEAIGVPLERVAPFARIAEMVHGATLAHDDVIDEATERRSKFSLNARMTQARAVLAGDLMLSRAMAELCELGHDSILKRMSEVLEDLVTGEWLQLENRGVMLVSPQALDTIAGYKTAAMVEWCAEIPLHVQGASSEEIGLARKFGHALGLAFQYLDDCIDFSAHSGKAFSHDLTEGLLNQVTFLMISKQPGLGVYFKAIMDQAVKVDRHSFVLEVGEAQLSSALKEVREKAGFQIQLAKEALLKLHASVGPGKGFGHLHDLIENLIRREE